MEEYWIVDVPGRVVEVHERPAGGRYASKTPCEAGELRPAAFADVVVAVGELVP